MKKIIVLMLSAFSSLPLCAEVLWQDFRLTYLNGNHYRLGDPQRQVLTIEHAAATSWGDSFFFLDHIRPNSGDVANYAEWAPRWSFSNMGLAEA